MDRMDRMIMMMRQRSLCRLEWIQMDRVRAAHSLHQRPNPVMSIEVATASKINMVEVILVAVHDDATSDSRRCRRWRAMDLQCSSD